MKTATDLILNNLWSVLPVAGAPYFTGVQLGPRSRTVSLNHGRDRLDGWGLAIKRTEIKRKEFHE
jgi:hypothetical protein